MKEKTSGFLKKTFRAFSGRFSLFAFINGGTKLLYLFFE